MRKISVSVSLAFVGSASCLVCIRNIRNDVPVFCVALAVWSCFVHVLFGLPNTPASGSTKEALGLALKRPPEGVLDEALVNESAELVHEVMQVSTIVQGQR